MDILVNTTIRLADTTGFGKTTLVGPILDLLRSRQAKLLVVCGNG